MTKDFFPVFIGLVLLACKPSVSDRTNNEYQLSEIQLDYARAFSLEKSAEGLYLIRTFHPSNPGDVLQEFTINHSSDDSILADFNGLPSKVAILSTTYLSFLSTLDVTESICCLSNGDLIYSQEIVDRLEKGLIKDLGHDQNFDFETLIDQQPDLIFFYDFSPNTAAFASRLEKTGIPVVRVGEYLETHPLGQSEWLKFFAVFFNKLTSAEHIFEDVKSAYEEISNNVQDNKSFEVLTDLPWKGEWHQAGGRSFQAQYIKDAGGAYIWKNDTSVAGTLMDREIIIEKALEADIWLNPGSANSIQEMIAIDPRFLEFKSVKNGDVYNNNNRLSERGGNDYWESGIMNPHIILKDLATIFQPGSFSENNLVYYQKLE
ncbi:MAG: ABC transporter substrate-binding protein [Vicingaceae bacterium]